MRQVTLLLAELLIASPLLANRLVPVQCGPQSKVPTITVYGDAGAEHLGDQLSCDQPASLIAMEQGYAVVGIGQRVGYVDARFVRPLQIASQATVEQQAPESPVIHGDPRPAQDGAQAPLPKAERPIVVTLARAGTPQENDATIQASGTGFFVTTDGYLLTNYHVVDKAYRIVVKVQQETYEARLIKNDSINDVALLKVSGTFKALSVASSRTVRLGDPIFTIGYPNPDIQGIEAKLTRGEINSLAGMQDDPRYFQISAPLQPGNSGGPLVNQDGNVVGVVTARLDDLKALKSTGSLPQNVNYAVKSSFAVAFLETVPDVTAKLLEPHASPERRSQDIIKDAQDATALILVFCERGRNPSDLPSSSRTDRTRERVRQDNRTPAEILASAKSICVIQPRGGNPVLEMEVRRRVENWGRLLVLDSPDDADLIIEVTQLGDYDPNNHIGTYASAMAVLRENPSRQQLWSVKKGSYWSFSSLSIDLIANQLGDAAVKFLDKNMRKKGRE